MVRTFASVASPELMGERTDTSNLSSDLYTHPNQFLEYSFKNVSNIFVNAIQENLLELCLLFFHFFKFYLFIALKQNRVLNAVLKNDYRSNTVYFQNKTERGIMFGSGNKHLFCPCVYYGYLFCLQLVLFILSEHRTDVTRPQMNACQVPSHCCCLNSRNVNWETLL